MNSEKWKVIGQAEAEFEHREHGKTSWFIRCCCGHLNMFYLWSWAGHGFAKCKGCGNRILYRTLEVEKLAGKVGE
jgi:hypothetical protein